MSIVINATSGLFVAEPMLGDAAAAEIAIAVARSICGKTTSRSVVEQWPVRPLPKYFLLKMKKSLLRSRMRGSLLPCRLSVTLIR